VSIAGWDYGPRFVRLGSIPHGSLTHLDLKQTVLDVTIFRHVRSGCVFPFRTNQSIPRIASPEVRIEVPAELAIMPRARFFWLRLTMKGVHDDGSSLAGLLGYRTRLGMLVQDVGLLVSVENDGCLPATATLNCIGTATACRLYLQYRLVRDSLVLEDVGSHFESWLDDRSDEKHSGEHTKQWNQYLRQAFVADPIGRRYARTIVLRLKFELGVAFGMVSAAFGLIWLALLGLGCGIVLAWGSVCVVFTIWNLYEASKSHKRLAETRAELLKEICIVR
jgi:hypothetical protein